MYGIFPFIRTSTVLRDGQTLTDFKNQNRSVFVRTRSTFARTITFGVLKKVCCRYARYYLGKTFLSRDFKTRWNENLLGLLALTYVGKAISSQFQKYAKI